MEPPITRVSSRQTSAESGMESMTAKVARGLPRKMQDHEAGEHQADGGFLDQVLDGQS